VDFKARVLVGFIHLRQATGPDLGGSDASANGAEDALALPLFDGVFVYQSSGYSPTEPITSALLGQDATQVPQAYALLRKIKILNI